MAVMLAYAMAVAKAGLWDIEKVVSKVGLMAAESVGLLAVLLVDELVDKTAAQWAS